MHEWETKPELCGNIEVYQLRCMFEGINHGGMNQEQWYQLNLEGGLWPWKEQKTIGHTIFSFLPSIQVISQPHKIHFQHYPLNQLGYGGAPFYVVFCNSCFSYANSQGMFEVNKNIHKPKTFIEGTECEGLLKCSMYMCISKF
jgi:hypothetical protein